MKYPNAPTPSPVKITRNHPGVSQTRSDKNCNAYEAASAMIAPHTAMTTSSRQMRRSSFANWRRSASGSGSVFVRFIGISNHTGELAPRPIQREQAEHARAAPPLAPEAEPFFDRFRFGQKRDLFNNRVEIGDSTARAFRDVGDLAQRAEVRGLADFFARRLRDKKFRFERLA